MNQSSKQNKRVASSLLVRSICSLFPKVKIISTGESKKGFHCECLFSHPFDDQALRMVEEELQRSIQEDLSIETVEMMRENAATLLQHRDQEYLAEQILDHPSNIIEMIRIEDFYGICPAPHLASTKEVGYVKLFQQDDGKTIKIEGVVKDDKKSLKKYLRMLSAFTDHVQIGDEAKLFDVNYAGCLWAPRGELVRSTLIDWWRSVHRSLGFGVVATSGEVENRVPCFQFGSQLAQIKESISEELLSPEGGLYDLPVRVGDQVWWPLDEKNAALSLNSYLHFIKKTVNMFHIDCKWIFYTKKSKSGRSQNKWDLSIEILKNALKTCKIEACIEANHPVDHPAIRGVYTDALGREWLGPLVELHDSKDYQMDQKSKSLVMVGSLFESLETLIAILLEANNGILPDWLAPEQVRILPVKEVDNAYAEQLAKKLSADGYRVSCEASTSPLSEKVYAARMCRVPYVLIIGKNERKNGTVAVNCYSEGEETNTMTIEEFLQKLQNKVEESRLHLE